MADRFTNFYKRSPEKAFSYLSLLIENAALENAGAI